MAEATIDELEIKIESDSNDAAQAIDRFARSLERLLAPVQALTGSGSGLAKLAKQLEKLSALSAAAAGLSNLDKVAQAANSLKALDNLSGAPNVTSYVKALNKLAQAGASVQAIAQFPDVTTQLTTLTAALDMLRSVQDIRLTGITNGLSKLPAAIQAINAMPDINAQKIRQLSRALSPLSGLNTRQISSLVSALNKLPQAANQVNQIDFTQFANSIRQLNTSLEPLVQTAERAGAGLTAISTILQYTQRNTNNTRQLGNTLGNLTVKSLLSWGSLLKLKNALTQCFQVSSQYVENLNLFNVTMGKSAATAMEFAEKVNDALGIDVSDWTRYQGFFQSVGKGFGVASEKADLMSKNLTQLAYDISSFYNISTDEAYNKVQSGFAGELEPLRRLGFALDEATLKQVAFNHGITQSYENMTQAQKAQLRYVAMIEQAKNIGVTGDMSRTIDTAANGVRVLEARIQQLARAVGNMLLPMLSAILPYVTAFVQVVTEAAQALANIFGFELPKIELGNISSGYDDVATAADDATAATEKFKGSLAGVDQLNIIGSHSDKNGTGTGYNTDLNIELPTYDFLNGVESKTKEIAENMKQWFVEALPWIEAVGAAIGIAFAGIKLGAFITSLKMLPEAFRNLSSVIGTKATGGLFGLVGGLAAGASSGILLYNSIKNLTKGTGDLKNNVGQLIGGLTIAVTAFVAFIAMGNPIGAIATAVGAIIGAVAGCTTAVKELNQETYNSVLYSDHGSSIKEIADAYSDWTSKLTEVDDKIKANQTAIEDNQRAIEEELDTLEDLTRSFEATGDMSEEMAQKITTASENISNAIKSNLTTDLNNMILGVGDAWDTVAKKAGMAKDEIMDALYANKSKGNEALDALQKQLGEYTATLATSEKGSSEYEAALSGYYDTMERFVTVSNAAIGQDESTLDLKSKLSSLTENEISLMDPETALSALQQIGESYRTATQKMLDTKNSAVASSQREYDVLKALGVDVNKSLYDAMEKGAIENYSTRITEITTETHRVIELLNKQIGDKISAASQAANQQFYDQFSKTIYDDGFDLGAYYGSAFKYINAYWQAFFSPDTNDSANSVMADEYLKSSGADEILDELNKISSDIDATMTLVSGEKTGSNGSTVDISEERLTSILDKAGIEYNREAISLKSAATPTGYATGYARSAIEDAYNGAAVNQAADSIPVENSVYVTVEIDGEEIANTTQRVASQQVAMANGR